MLRKIFVKTVYGTILSYSEPHRGQRLAIITILKRQLIHQTCLSNTRITKRMIAAIRKIVLLIIVITNNYVKNRNK